MGNICSCVERERDEEYDEPEYYVYSPNVDFSQDDEFQWL